MRAFWILLCVWSLSFPDPSSSLPSSLTSSFWKPTQKSTCETLSHSAPCIAESFGPEYGGVLGYEYEYRDFEIAFPFIDDEENLKLWVQRVLQSDLTTGESLGRTWVDFEKKLLRYYGQHGQTFIFRRRKGPAGDFTSLSPFGKWGLTECMGPHVPHNYVTKEEVTPDRQKPIKLAIYAGVPDGHSWQHFMDRGTHVLLQTEMTHDFNHSVQVIGAPPRTAPVREMYSIFNLPSPVRAAGNAEEIAFSCRAPLIHPYFSFKTKEVVFNHLQLPPQPKLKERKKIYYAPRGQNRKVLNEKEVLDTIREVLKERNLGEELVIFELSADFKGVVREMQQNCSAFIGAHGGAMYNAKWCPEDSLVVEFIPSTRPSIMFFEESQLLQQHYQPMVLKGEKNHNINVPLEKFKDILLKKLGTPPPSPTIIHSPRSNPPLYNASSPNNFLNEAEIRTNLLPVEQKKDGKDEENEEEKEKERKERRETQLLRLRERRLQREEGKEGEEEEEGVEREEGGMVEREMERLEKMRKGREERRKQRDREREIMRERERERRMKEREVEKEVEREKSEEWNKDFVKT